MYTQSKNIGKAKDKNHYLEKCFCVSPSVVSRKIGDEFILVPVRPKTGELNFIYTMNEVAGRIWELIDSKRRVSEIRDKIIEEFDIKTEQAESDIMDLLQQLKEIEAVREV